MKSLRDGGTFRMTWKTRIYLKIWYFFHRIGKIGQYFISHCDMEEEEMN